MDIARDVCRLTQPFLVAATYGLSSQVRRAAVSIASNIAEGHGRELPKETLIDSAYPRRRISSSLIRLGTRLRESDEIRLLQRIHQGFARFIGIARGALAELQTLLMLCKSLRFHSRETDLSARLDELGRMMRGMQRALDS